jgi:radical SAM protein with 4Fe4S-binding SPASM domain
MVQASGRGEKMAERDQVLDFHKLVEFGKWVESYLQKKSKIPVYYNWPAAFYSLKNLMDFEGYSCRIFNILGILHTGHLSMCGIGSQVPELCYGILGKNDVSDVWINQPMLIELRKELPVKLEGICEECVLQKSCLGSCIAQNYYMSKRLTAPYWFCQMADESGIFPTGRKKSNISTIIKKREVKSEISKTICS